MQWKSQAGQGVGVEWSRYGEVGLRYARQGKGIDRKGGHLSSKGMVWNRIERQKQRWDQISRGKASCSDALMVMQSVKASE